MLQALLRAEVCDVEVAITLKDTHGACVVLYHTPADLSATAAQLGMPVVVKPGIKYCYQLPAAAAAASRRHCQVSDGRQDSC